MYFVQITRVNHWKEHILKVDIPRHFTIKRDAEIYLCTQLHKEMAEWGYEEMMEKIQNIDKKYRNEIGEIKVRYHYDIEAMTHIFTSSFMDPDDEPHIEWILDEVNVDMDRITVL